MSPSFYIADQKCYPNTNHETVFKSHAVKDNNWKKVLQKDFFMIKHESQTTPSKARGEYFSFISFAHYNYNNSSKL